MDKNTIVGLVIIAGILVLYSVFSRPSEEERAAQNRRQDSIAQEHQQQIIQDSLDYVNRILLEHKGVQGATTTLSTGTAARQTVADQQARTAEYENIYGAFAGGATGEKKFITLENDRILLKVSMLGGRIYSVQLKDYQTHDSLPLILFNGDSTIFGLNFFAQNRSINTNDLYFTAGTNESHLDASTSPVSMDFSFGIFSLMASISGFRTRILAMDI